MPQPEPWKPAWRAGFPTWGHDVRQAVESAETAGGRASPLTGDELSKADESTLYHHYQLNYTPPDTERGPTRPPLTPPKTVRSTV
jgi:hypothetical protein